MTEFQLQKRDAFRAADRLVARARAIRDSLVFSAEYTSGVQLGAMARCVLLKQEAEELFAALSKLTPP